MKIKITPENAEKIEAALRAVNGAAEAHTFTQYSSISIASERAEQCLDHLGLLKVSRKGAEFAVRSGGQLPKSYRGRRNVTRVALQRGASDWYLTGVTAGSAYQEAGGSLLSLTPLQRDEAVRKLTSTFSVL